MKTKLLLLKTIVAPKKHIIVIWLFLSFWTYVWVLGLNCREWWKLVFFNNNGCTRYVILFQIYHALCLYLIRYFRTHVFVNKIFLNQEIKLIYNCFSYATRFSLEAGLLKDKQSLIFNLDQRTSTKQKSFRWIKSNIQIPARYWDKNFK